MPLAADGSASGWDNPPCYFCAIWVPGAVGERRWRCFDVGQLTDVRIARLNTRIRNEYFIRSHIYA
jgi:hypothetical protein